MTTIVASEQVSGTYFKWDKADFTRKARRDMTVRSSHGRLVIVRSYGTVERVHQRGNERIKVTTSGPHDHNWVATISCRRGEVREYGMARSVTACFSAAGAALPRLRDKVSGWLRDAVIGVSTVLTCGCPGYRISVYKRLDYHEAVNRIPRVVSFNVATGEATVREEHLRKPGQDAPTRVEPNCVATCIHGMVR